MKLITAERRDWSSSLIKHTEFNPDDKQLIITFQNGKDYLYYDITENDYQEFCSAESQGSYFGKNIRGKKDFSIISKSGEISVITKALQDAKDGDKQSI